MEWLSNFDAALFIGLISNHKLSWTQVPSESFNASQWLVKFTPGIHQYHLPGPLPLPVEVGVVLGSAGQLQQDPGALLRLPAERNLVTAGHLQLEVCGFQRLALVVQDRVLV